MEMIGHEEIVTNPSPMFLSGDGEKSEGLMHDFVTQD
jgi:hypothetical protein